MVIPQQLLTFQLEKMLSNPIGQVSLFENHLPQISGAQTRRPPITSPNSSYMPKKDDARESWKRYEGRELGQLP